ncbi:MAG: outer membrane protein assembly factor BamE [Verrucomicrobiota bacterium]|nr:outer membrane protein assembly factor BamE [Verrucomicrobiota bacterium]
MRTILLLLTTIAVLGLSACNQTLSGSKVTQANYDKITTGMSKSQVQEILGKASNVNDKDFLIMKKTTWRYEDGDRFVMITFKNDEVDSKESNLH